MFLSFALVVVGIALLIWYSKIAKFLYAIQRPAHKWMFGWLLDVEKPWFRSLYTIGVIFTGVVLLLVAYANYFGPTSL